MVGETGKKNRRLTKITGVLQPVRGLPAVTDCKCGVTLRAISTFCTGLLTVFLNGKVTGLAGLMSYLLLWKSFRTVPR